MMLVLLGLMGEASAVTRTVTTTSDVVNPLDGVLSLREALAAALLGDTIVFSTVVFPTGTRTTINVTGATLAIGADNVLINGDGRVTLDGTLAPAGTTGLEVMALGVDVRGLQIEDFSDYGILVSAGNNQVIGGTGVGNIIKNTGDAGIHIGDTGVSVAGTQVLDNEVDHACLAPTGACAGIQIHGSGTVSTITVGLNTVTATQGDPNLSQGIGILAQFGSDHVIESNVVGGAGTGNLSYGIAVMSGSTTVSDVAVLDNEVRGNGGNGIHLGPRSLRCEVEDNLVGLNSTGTGAVPNQGAGIAIFGSDQHVLRDNVVSGNNGPGIRMGGATGANWQSDHLLVGNLVGLDVTGSFAIPNTETGILSQGNEGGSQIGGDSVGEGNVISGNARHGIRLEDHTHLVQGNRIGTNAGGTSAVPNGTATGSWAGISIGGTGIDVGGDFDRTGDLPALGPVNQVSGNTDDGIRIESTAAFAIVAGNLVGASATGDGALGNGRHGIFNDSSNGSTIGSTTRQNVVLANASDGVRVGSANAAIPTFFVTNNVVGRGLLGAVHGNGGDGIRVQEGANAISFGRVSENEVRGNGGVGLRIVGADPVEVSRNTFHGNTACAYVLESGANGGLSAPTLVFRNGRSLGGSVSLPPAGQSIERVEVFWDDGDEASMFLGEATVSGTTWELQTTDFRPFPVGGRISTTVTRSTLATSALQPACGDGCATVVTGTCSDGNPCTTDTCTVAGCTFTNNTASCSDGNSCTSSDVCSAGTCQPGSPVPGCGLDKCSETHPTLGDVQKDCSDTDLCGTIDSCLPATGACVHSTLDLLLEALCFDGDPCTADSCDGAVGCVPIDRPLDFVCDDDDACTGLGTCDGVGNCQGASSISCPYENVACGTTASCDPVEGCTYEAFCGDGDCSSEEICSLCADCGALDSDGDGFRDSWEAAPNPGVDTNCDGVKDVFLPNADPNVPNVWVELDYMDDDDHSHEPLAGVVAAIEQVFDDEGIILTIEVDDALPHADVIKMETSVAPTAPNCEDWAYYYDLKRTHYDPRRRGFYHYVIFAHQLNDCTSDTSGRSEGGDDFVVTLGAYDGEVGTFEQQRGTLMHELGHDLGLGHGGGDGSIDPDQRDMNWKPNYQSVMSYRYQFVGLDEYGGGGANLSDYSHEDLPTLDETALDESDGLGSVLNLYFASYECPYPAVTCPGPLGQDIVCFRTNAPSGPLNWDCDEAGNLTVVSQETNYDGVQTELEGHDDWGNLDLQFQCDDVTYADGASAESGELTQQEAEERGVLHPDLHPVAELMPSCSFDPVAQDGTGKVQLAVLGDSELDVTSLVVSSLELATASPTASQVLDVDGDLTLDVVTEYLVADLEVAYPLQVAAFSGWRTNGQRISGMVDFEWVSTAVDADGDGVDEQHGCDVCPTQAGTAASPDGCP
jgi:hypothetical protein